MRLLVMVRCVMRMRMHGGMEWSSRQRWRRSDTLAGHKGHPVFYGKMIYLIPDSHDLLLRQRLLLVSE